MAEQPESRTRAASSGPNQRESHYVQSLERGLSVITAFGPDAAELTLSDVARLTGLTRAAARRFLLTLADLGFVRQDGKLFRLTPEGAGAGLRVPVQPVAAGRGRAAPGVAGPRGRRVVVDVGARRPRHRLRRPGADLADHDGRDQRGHPLPGVRHLDGAGAAGGAGRRGARGPPRPPRPGGVHGAHGAHRRRAARPAARGAAAGLRAGRPGAGVRPALHRRPGPRPHRQPSSPPSTSPPTSAASPASAPAASCCRRCCTRSPRSRPTCPAPDDPGPDEEHHAHPGRHRRRRPRRAAALAPARPGRGRLGPRGEPLAGLRAGPDPRRHPRVVLGGPADRGGPRRAHRPGGRRAPRDLPALARREAPRRLRGPRRPVGVGLRADRGHQGPDGRPGAGRPARLLRGLRRRRARRRERPARR